MKSCLSKLAVNRDAKVGRFTVAVAALVGLLSAPVNADDYDFKKRWYVGAGVGISSLEPDTNDTIFTEEDDDDTGYKVTIGYDLGERWSLEAFFADLGEAEFDPFGEVEYEASGIGALYYWRGQRRDDDNAEKRLAIYVKGGLANLETPANIPVDRLNDVQVYVGIGAEYPLGKGFALRAEAESYDDDAAFFSLNLIKRFGSKASSPTPAPAPVAAVVDSDNDGVPDSRDRCPNSAPGATVNANGCADSDNDGVLDRDDRCPRSAPGAKVNARGCADTDGDEIIDRKDRCPNSAPGARVNVRGCADTDGDEIIDRKDLCPNTPAGVAVNTKGCALFQGKLEGVNFATNSAELTSQARGILKAVAEQLSATEINVEVQAHTDSQGSAAYNQQLSQRRAESVVDYLVEQGIDRGRMRPSGLGESQPIADNNTLAGRAENRRVEFVVIK